MDVSCPLPAAAKHEVIKDNQITSWGKQNNEISCAKAFKLVMDEAAAGSSDPSTER